MVKFCDTKKTVHFSYKDNTCKLDNTGKNLFKTFFVSTFSPLQELNEKLAITLVSETPVNSTLALTSCKKPEWKFKLTAKVLFL